MENRKCVQCGLVNFAGVTECARCQAFIPKVVPGAAGVNPFERDGTKPFNPLPLVGILAFVLVAAVVGFSMFGGDSAKTAADASPNAPIHVNAAKMDQIRDELWKKDGERMAKEWEESNQAFKDMERSQKEAFKNIKAPECKTTGYTSNPSTGTYTPTVECK